MNARGTLRLLGACGAAAAWLPPSLHSQEAAEAASFDAESVFIDLGTNETIFKGLRISDGHVTISAGEGRSGEAEGGNVDWRLRGDVIVAFESAVVESDEATFRFGNGRLLWGELLGDPARFEAASGNAVRGAANRIDYNHEEGVFTATGNASFVMAEQYHVRCNWIYDVRQQSAVGFPDAGDRCRIEVVEGDQAR